MKTLLATTMFLAACFVSRAVSPLSGPIVNPANSHTYYLLADSTWTDAEAYGLTLGGHLVTINDAAEQTWVYSTFSTYSGGDRTLWIGLNDAASEGTFVWSSGEAVGYTHWHIFEPNNYQGAEDYGSIFAPSDSRSDFWNDADNFNTSRPSGIIVPANGVIEVVPEPNAFALLAAGAMGLAAFRKARKQA
jgi:hypothetical protein